MIALIPSQAHAAEHHHASSADRPSTGKDWYCTDNANDYAAGCFAPEGDWFLLDDKRADGYSVVVSWQLYNAFDVMQRSGFIWYSEGEGAGYGYENMDFYEGYGWYVHFKACRGNHSTHDVHLSTCSDWRDVGV
ncbi:hypothetical protein ACLB9X_33550 [Streptomyces sp. 5K101]|uniref:hypothetical protein n=1 Tax=Streptomyces sp. 5K101 TaxID=3390037 RepID=UPI0039759DC6